MGGGLMVLKGGSKKNTYQLIISDQYVLWILTSCQLLREPKN